MTNETKHTPTPWVVENWHGDTQIVGPEGSLICINTTYYPIAPSEEDMAHIVKCVNMHEELVDALDKILDNNNDENWHNALNVLKKAGAL